jgi:acyl carrier protein
MRKIEELEALGSEILILQADVADEQAMGLALAQIDRRFGELHGLIHAAGSIGSDTFREIVEADSAQAEAQFKAKVHGLLVLARLLAGRPLDFCLLTSSLSAILGGLGFAAYSAANLFMDAFVCSQELRAGPRWISVNLDSWELAGARPTVVGVGGTVSQFVMKPDEGAEAIERILAERGLNRVAVSTGDLQARFDVWVNRDRQPAAAVTLHDRPALATAYQAPRSELETRLAAIWEDLFGIAPIGITDNFFALGGHSLLATQLNARLYAALGVEMTLARLLQAPTIADLGAAIVAARADSVETAALESMLAEIEQMPDDAQPGREALLSRQGAAGDR